MAKIDLIASWKFSQFFQFIEVCALTEVSVRPGMHTYQFQKYWNPDNN